LGFWLSRKEAIKEAKVEGNPALKGRIWKLRVWGYVIPCRLNLQRKNMCDGLSYIFVDGGKRL